MNEGGGAPGWLVKLLIAALTSPVVIRVLDAVVGRKNNEQLAEIRSEFSAVNARLTALELAIAERK